MSTPPSTPVLDSSSGALPLGTPSSNTALSPLTVPVLPMASSASPSAQQPIMTPKRRRINGKQTASQNVPNTVAAPTPVKKLNIKWMEESEWHDLAGYQRNDWIFTRVKSYWATQVFVDDPSVSSSSSPSPARTNYKNQYKFKMAMWSKLSKREKYLHLSNWADMTDPPPFVTVYIDQLLKGKSTSGSVGKSFLLTYVGKAWGDFRHPSPQPRSASGRNIDSVVSEMQADPYVEAQWSSMVKGIERVAKLANARDWAACLEVCPQTLESEGLARLHVHVSLMNFSGMSLPKLNELKVLDVQPHLANFVGGLSAQKAARAWSGFFYCAAEKVGSVFRHSTKRPFRDFNVSNTWVMTLLQANKINLKLAREYAILSCNNVSRTLHEISLLEKERELASVKEYILRTEAELQQQRSAFRVLPEVETWRAQYASTKERYKFLVLSGPSRVGKTLFTKSLVPDGAKMWECTCSNGQTPDLRGFKFTEHKLVLYDEIEAPLIAAERKLFQASNSLVQLGGSATNCHSYEILVHRVMMVCASNNWESSLARCSDADREWINSNSIYVYVDTPLWVTP